MLEEAVIFLILYAVLAFTDLVPVFKTKKKKAIIFMTIVFAAAVLLQYMIIVGIELPKFTKLTEEAVKALGLIKGE